MLAVGGGALGLLLGTWGRNVLWSFRPVENNFVELTIDGRVLAFGVALSLLTGVMFGSVPALQASRSPAGDALKDARSAGRSGRGTALRHALVVGQMALSLVALVSAALFLRSIQQAYAIDPGFDASKLALASVGIYGVLAYSVAQRTREVGLRIALGANPSSVRMLVLRQAMKLVGIGVALGLIGALLLGRSMASLLYGLSGSDAVALIGASLTLVLVSALACYLPARRASRIDPAVSLREA